jgi:hypothetical protein
VDPREFHRLAESLCAGTGAAAELRCAVGRAYYAAYNVAATMLRDCGVAIPRNAGGHGEALRYLGNSGDPDLTAAGHKLATLRSRRNAADYDLTNAVVEDAKTVRSLVETAGRVIESMDACLADPGRAAKVKAALEAYRQAIAPRPPP